MGRVDIRNPGGDLVLRASVGGWFGGERAPRRCRLVTLTLRNSALAVSRLCGLGERLRSLVFLLPTAAASSSSTIAVSIAFAAARRYLAGALAKPASTAFITSAYSSSGRKRRWCGLLLFSAGSALFFTTCSDSRRSITEEGCRDLAIATAEDC